MNIAINYLLCAKVQKIKRMRNNFETNQKYEKTFDLGILQNYIFDFSSDVFIYLNTQYARRTTSSSNVDLTSSPPLAANRLKATFANEPGEGRQLIETQLIIFYFRFWSCPFILYRFCRVNHRDGVFAKR